MCVFVHGCINVEYLNEWPFRKNSPANIFNKLSFLNLVTSTTHCITNFVQKDLLIASFCYKQILMFIFAVIYSD